MHSMPSAEGETSCWPLELVAPQSLVSSFLYCPPSPKAVASGTSCTALAAPLIPANVWCDQCIQVASSWSPLQLKQREEALQAPHELCMGQTPTAAVPSCPPQSSNDWSMLNTRRPSWYQTTAVLPRSCMRHLTPQLPELHSRLHRAAISGKAIQRDTQGKHA